MLREHQPSLSPSRAGADGTPWPMGWIIGLGGVGSWAVAALLVRASRPGPAGSAS